jgi:hypothetical protein
MQFLFFSNDVILNGGRNYRKIKGEHIRLAWIKLAHYFQMKRFPYALSKSAKPLYIEEQTKQWPKEKVQKDTQRSTKHSYKTKDRVTRTPLKTGGELRCIGRVGSYWSISDTRDRGLLLTRKLLNQGFLIVKLKPSLPKFYGRHHDLVDRYGISVSQMTTDVFHCNERFNNIFEFFREICDFDDFLATIKI